MPRRPSPSSSPHRQPPRRDRARLPRELRDVRVDPRKSLGQHFLIDDDVPRAIVALADIPPGATVIEVGAGLGALTAPLAATGARVLAVEIDETLCSHLRTRFPDEDVQVACIDVLSLQPEDLLALAGLKPPYYVVANLPYYITAFVLQHFLEADAPPERMVVMVQREVAQRLVAGPPKLSMLGVAVQVYAEPRFGFRVPPSAFYPPPRVDSAVVRLDSRRHPALPEDRASFFAVVRAGFRQPRKQLHNALPLGLWFPPGGVVTLLEDAGIDGARRAQTLSIEEWAILTAAYENARERWRLAGDG